MKKTEAKYVPSNDKSEKQDEKFKDFDDEDNPIFLTPAIRVDVETKTYEEEVFKPRKEGPGKMKLTREKKVKSITRDDEKNYFGLTFKEKVKEIKDGKINFVRTLDGKEVQKETYRKYDESQYNKIQQRYQSLIDDEDRNLSEEQIKSLMEGFVNQIFFNRLDTLPTDTESRKRIKEAQDKMKDRSESQKTPEMARGRKEKEKESKLEEYSNLIGKIIDSYSSKEELTKGLYRDIINSRKIYSDIPEKETQRKLDMFSLDIIDDFELLRSLEERLSKDKESEGFSENDRTTLRLLTKLSRRYAGGLSGYDVIQKIHRKIPELNPMKMDDNLRRDVLSSMKPLKQEIPELEENLTKLKAFTYLDNESGVESLIALNEDVESQTDSLEDSNEFVEMEESKRKLKTARDSRERLSKKHIRYRDMNTEQLDRLRQLKEYDVPSDEEMQEHKKDLAKNKKTISLLRDRISELEPVIRAKTAQIKKNKKILLGFEQQVSGVLEGIIDYLDELEEEGKFSDASKFKNILEAYVTIAEELNLYVDKDARDYMVLLDASSRPLKDLDLDAMLREVKSDE